MTYIVYWAGSLDYESEMFDTREEAERQAKAWSERYPWNTYTVGKVTPLVTLPARELPKRGPVFKMTGASTIKIGPGGSGAGGGAKAG